MIIEYKGQKLDSTHFNGELDKEILQDIRENFYDENKKEALKQLKKVLLENKVATHKIYAYYFERIAYNTKLYHNKWCINEILECDELLQVAYNRTLLNKKVYSQVAVKNLRKLFSLGGKGFASKPTNFPLKECVRILKEYVTDDKKQTYIDPSCGWGIRMIASAVLDLDYIGFDVNKELIPKLQELGKDIQTFKPNFKFKIYEQGSQYVVPELENSANIILTSPPYFNLEIYGDNSLEKENSMVSYEGWLLDFVKPMMYNMSLYAKENVPIMFNIKNFKDYDLVGDFEKIGEDLGLHMTGYDSLKNNKRINSEGLLNDNSEVILIFKKTS